MRVEAGSVNLKLSVRDPPLVSCTISVASPSPSTDAVSSVSGAASSLLALPVELLLEVVSGLDIPSLGMAASSCWPLLRLCEREGVWTQLCARQGLAVQEGGTPQASLRVAATCGHAADQWPSQAFLWEIDALGWRCECMHCGRRYDVHVSSGFVDTPTFASKLVTRAAFSARHEAPRGQQSFVALWESRAAIAAKKAAEMARSIEAGNIESWSSGLAFLGPLPHSHGICISRGSDRSFRVEITG